MAYKVPSLEGMTSFLVGFWKALFPGSNVGSRFSYHWKRMRAYAGGVTDLHAHIVSAINDVMPDTATGAMLTRWGGIVGVGKKTASGARRASALRVTGLAGKVINVGDELTHEPTGFTFEVTREGTIAANGQVDVDVQATSTGAATRLLAGEKLTFVAPAAGVNAVATLVLDLNEGGYDAEQDPSYSVRVNDELAKPRMGGSQDDFEKWLLAFNGSFQIELGKAYPNRAGYGTVDIAAFKAGDGSSRSLTSTERAELLAWLKEPPDDVKAKVFSGMPGQLTGGAARILETLADVNDVEIAILTNGETAYAFDWIDSVPPVVQSYDAATRTVTLTADRPASMLAGHRVCFKGVATPTLDGAPLTIEQLVSTNAFILKTAPNANPANTDLVYAGGKLTAQIRDAIRAHMNGQVVYADKGKPLPASSATAATVAERLRVLAQPIGPNNPAGGAYGEGVYGDWNGKLLLAELFKISAYSTGVRNVTIVKPTADRDPGADFATGDTTYPNDHKIYFIAPRLVLVRKAW